MLKNKLNICISLLSVFICINTAFAQKNRQEYYNTLKKAKKEMIARDYTDCLADIRSAQTDADDYQFNSWEADEMLKAVLNQQAEDLQNQFDKQLNECSQYIATLMEMVKQDPHSSTDLDAFKKLIVSKLIAARNAVDASSNNTSDISLADMHLQLAEYDKRSGDNESAYNEYETGFNIIKKILPPKKTIKADLPEPIFITLDNIGAGYITFLANKGQNGDALAAIDACHEATPDIINTAQGYDAVGRIELASGYRDVCISNYHLAKNHYTNALNAFGKAVSMQPQNIALISDLFNARNLIMLEKRADVINVDSLYQGNISTDKLAARLALSVEADISSATTLIQYRNGQCAVFLKNDKIKAVKDTAEKLFQLEDEYFKQDSAQKQLLLLRSGTNICLADIYHEQHMQKEERSCLNNALKDWLASFQPNQQLNANPLLLAITGKQLQQHFMAAFRTDEIYDADQQMIGVVVGTELPSIKYSPICYLLAQCYQTNARILENKKDAAAIKLYDEAIANYEDAGLLLDNSFYTTDFADYAHAYKEKLENSVDKRDTTMVMKTYHQLSQILMPTYHLYDFDIKLGWELTEASKIYGMFLYSIGKYTDAIQPLEFASYHGMQSCTKALSEIYTLLNQPYKDQLRERLAEQSSDVPNEFTLPVEGGELDQTIKVYIMDRPSNYPYKGIEDAAKWVKIAYNATINQHYVDEFNRAQYVAWANQSSLKRLSDQAVYKAKTDLNILNKYTPQKAKIKQAVLESDKISLSARLYKTYEGDLKAVDTTGRKAIIQDAVSFYIDYAKLLGQAPEARGLYQRVLELDAGNKDAIRGLMEIDYNEHPTNFNKNHSNDNPEQLIKDFDFYLAHRDYDQAEKVKKKILRGDPGPEIRDRINMTYMSYNKEDDHFTELFLEKGLDPAPFITYFANKKIDSVTNDYKWQYYNDITTLDQLYLQDHPQDSIRISASEHFSKFVWYCMLTQNHCDLTSLNDISLKYDPDNKLAALNTVNIYLYYNDFPDAKKAYDTLKKKGFEKDGKYQSFREYFLGSITELRKNNVYSEAIDNFYRLLENEDIGISPANSTSIPINK